MQRDETFRWAIYADATLAGLSVLIPLPFVDSLFENFFRRRMIKSIAQRNEARLNPELIALLNHTPRDFWSGMRSCLLWPLRFTVELLLSLSRKILYFLSVKKAIDALNFYWQRAYLLNYMIREGHLQSNQDPASAVGAMERVLREHGTSPLNRLAAEVVRRPHRLVRALWHAKQGKEDQKIVETRQTMRQQWHDYDTYFRRLQERYEELYQADHKADPPHFVERRTT